MMNDYWNVCAVNGLRIFAEFEFKDGGIPCGRAFLRGCCGLLGESV